MLNFLHYLEEKFRFTLKYHSKLNPKLWSHDQLKVGIGENLLSLAYEFAEFSGVDKSRIKDIIVTGGNVNFNYTKYSDIDVHLMCTLTGLDDDLIYNKKVAWSGSRTETIAGYPLEFYIADEGESPPKGQGFYSILNDRWIVMPKHLGHIEALEDPFVVDKIQDAIKYIKFLIKSGTHEQISAYKLKMHNMRQSGLQLDGEFSIENIMYKELRNRGWIEKLNTRYHTLD